MVLDMFSKSFTYGVTSGCSVVMCDHLSLVMYMVRSVLSIHSTILIRTSDILCYINLCCSQHYDTIYSLVITTNGHNQTIGVQHDVVVLRVKFAD